MAPEGWERVSKTKRETVWVYDKEFPNGDVLRVIVSPWGDIGDWLVDFERSAGPSGEVMEEYGESGRYPDGSREFREREEAEDWAWRKMKDDRFVKRAYEYLNENPGNNVDEVLGF